MFQLRTTRATEGVFITSIGLGCQVFAGYESGEIFSDHIEFEVDI